MTLTGTPTNAVTSLEVDISLTGIRGAATFQWLLNGSVQQTGQTTAATFALGSTGITANFPTGTYTNNDVYTAKNTMSSWADQSGVGNPALAQATASKRPLFSSADSGYNLSSRRWPSRRPTPTLLSTTAPWGAALSQPCTWFVVGQSTQAGAQYNITDGIVSSNRQVFLTTTTNVEIYAGGAGASGAASVTSASMLMAEESSSTTRSAIFVNSTLSFLALGSVNNETLTRLTVGSEYVAAPGFYLNGKVAGDPRREWECSAAVAEPRSARYLGSRYGAGWN